MPRKITISLICAALVAMLALPVAAQQTGSLLVKKIYSPVTLYCVADDQGNWSQDFAGAVTGELNDETANAAMAKALQNKAREKNLSGQEKTPDGACQVFYEQLEKGYYLVCSQAQPGEFAPFILQIPMTVADKTIYNVQAEPKNEGPSDPDDPGSPPPLQPVIPQTGHIQWPKYLLLALGVLFIIAGTVEGFRGRRQTDE